MTCTHDIIEKDNACADGMCPICLAAENERLAIAKKVKWRPTEPAREPAYRKSQEIIHDRLANQDGCITWLLVELRALQKRVDKLEKHNAHTAANMVRAAYERAEDKTN